MNLAFVIFSCVSGWLIVVILTFSVVVDQVTRVVTVLILKYSRHSLSSYFVRKYIIRTTGASIYSS